MISDQQWKIIKAMLDSGWKVTEVAEKIPNITAQQIYYKRKTYYDPNAKENERFNSVRYKQWRYNVLKRYNFCCAFCKKKGTRRNPIQADHLLPWASHSALRFEVTNGRALCKSCHLKTPTFGYKASRYKGKLQ